MKGEQNPTRGRESCSLEPSDLEWKYNCSWIRFQACVCVCVHSLLVLASRHMLLCSISAVTAEACGKIACFTKTERRSWQKYFIKPSLSFCVVCSAFAWCLLLACGVNIQTLAVMHPWHDSAVTGACWSARAGHSGPPGWVTAATLEHEGNVPRLQHSFKLCSFSCSWMENHGRFIHPFQLPLLYQRSLNQSNSGNIPEAF